MSDEHAKYQAALKQARQLYPNRSPDFHERFAREAAGLPLSDPPEADYNRHQAALAEAKALWPNRGTEFHEAYAEEKMAEAQAHQGTGELP